MIESDQQIGEYGRGLPENEEQQQVVGQDNAQHGNHEKVKKYEESTGLGMTGHVARCEQRHKDAASGDDQAEQHAQPVDRNLRVMSRPGTQDHSEIKTAPWTTWGHALHKATNRDSGSSVETIPIGLEPPVVIVKVCMG